MNHGHLISHVDTDVITRRASGTRYTRADRHLQAHSALRVDRQLDRVLNQADMHITEERFAVRRDGSVLFGVLQLAYGETQDGIAALGLRTDNNKTMSLQICAGLSVFVSDNMCFGGDLIALKRKHTSGLNLREELTLAVLRFKDHFAHLTEEVAILKNQMLADIDAKALIHDVFADGLMPLRFLPDVSKSYFEPTLKEFEARNAWSLP
jgi:hypothetical protein